MPNSGATLQALPAKRDRQARHFRRSLQARHFKRRFQALPFKGRVGWGWCEPHRQRTANNTMRGQTSRFIKTRKIQRQLRKRPTVAESKLWQHLRLRQLNGHKFRRQHPYYNAVLDFVCLERKLVVEVDGSQHSDAVSDEIRDARLLQDGFTILRFWNNDVLTRCDDVLRCICAALESATAATDVPDCTESRSV